MWVSGKSTVCKLFQDFGVPVYYSDYHASVIINHDEEVVGKMKNSFGEDIYENGKLRRKFLADIVFNDKDKLETLNSIIHPSLGIHFENWCKVEGENSDYSYVIEESAIGIELGIQDKFDKVIVVTADEDVRIKRVMSRDNCTEELVRDRMKNQMSDEEKIKHADVVIINNNDSDIESQVKAINTEVLKQIGLKIVQ